MKNENSSFNKFKPVLFLGFGVIMVITAICLLLYDRFMLVKDEVFTEIEMRKAEEKNNSELMDDDINDIEDDPTNNENNNKTNNKGSSSSKKRSTNYVSNRYLGYLTISKIGLKAGIPWKDSSMNNVDKGVYTLPVSNYPDVENGNLVLAGHSGNASISYFKNLWKLAVGDSANVSYNGKTYSYKIVDIYYVEKTGTVQIRRNTKKTTLTLITCTKDSDTLQTVYILELYAIDGVSYG
jgi:LPXTG-site transpeptidase (sortase) family protein